MRAFEGLSIQGINNGDLIVLHWDSERSYEDGYEVDEDWNPCDARVLVTNDGYIDVQIEYGNVITPIEKYRIDLRTGEATDITGEAVFAGYVDSIKRLVRN